MSRMTSSICTNDPADCKQQQATTATKAAAGNSASQRAMICNQDVKTLTNFSIESIIGLHDRGNDEHTPVVTNAPAKQRRTPKDSGNHRPIEIDKSVQHGKWAASNDNQQLQQQQHQYQQQPQIKKYRPKNFQCFVCRMAFSNNGQLKNHVRIHTGERPFRCNEHNCGKSFTRNEELTRHKLIHTGERPHECPKCNKNFGRKDHLKKHLRTHERKKRVYVPSARLKQPYIFQQQTKANDPFQQPQKLTTRKVQASRPIDIAKLPSTSIAPPVNPAPHFNNHD